MEKRWYFTSIEFLKSRVVFFKKRLEPLRERNFFTAYLFLILLCPVIGKAQSFWLPTNGPYGGLVYSFASSKQGDLYAGTRGGVFRSTDQGDHWVGTALNDKLVLAVAVDSSGNIFAGTDYYGILRSTDKGATWEPMNVGLSVLTPVVFSLVVSPIGHLFSCTSSGLYRSINSGATWSRLFSGFVQKFAIDSNGYLFLANLDDGIYRSKDNGATWARIVATFGSFTGLCVKNNDVFVGVFNNTGPGVLRSTDSGNSWTQVNNGLTTYEIRSMAIGSDNEIFVGTRRGIFRSTNKGDNWTESGMTDTAAISLFNYSTGFLFAGTVGGGILRTTDHGITWVQKNQGLRATIVQSLVVNSNGDIFAGTLYDGVHRSTDNGNNWMRVNSGLANSSVWSFAMDSNDNIFTGTDAGLFRSTNNAATWTQIYSSLTHPEVKSVWVTQQGEIFLGAGIDISGDIALFSGSVFRSSDAGNSWENIANGLPNRTVYALEGDRNGYLFAAVLDSGIYRSTNQGGVWESTSLKRTIYSLAIDSLSNMFAGSSRNGIFRSTDNGISWFPLSGAIANQTVRSIKVNSVNNIFACTDSTGIYRSTDHGGSWVQLNNGLVKRSIYSLAFNPGGYAFLGTDGSGVFRSVNPTTAISEEPRFPSSFVLYQNYPNPFNPTTTIEFELPKDSYVEISVYDLLGRRITTIIKEVMQAGVHRSTFNAAGLPSGLYACTMKADKFLQTKTMLLLK